MEEGKQSKNEVIEIESKSKKKAPSLVLPFQGIYSDLWCTDVMFQGITLHGILQHAFFPLQNSGNQEVFDHDC